MSASNFYDSDGSPKTPVICGVDDDGNTQNFPLVREDADPGSPGGAQQSSDDSSSSSDGVIVDLPCAPDQESRILREDGDSGVLVNIDGSILENSFERGDDAGREETFVDAPEYLGGRGVDLPDSVTMIDVMDRSEDERFTEIRARLEVASSECRKYKEEREFLEKEIVGLRCVFHELVERQSLCGGLPRLEHEDNRERSVSYAEPLHSMIIDCSKLVDSLKGMVDENMHVTRELRENLFAKDMEIKTLEAAVSEKIVAHDVVASYLSSFHEVWSNSFSSEVQNLEKFLSESDIDLSGSKENDPGFVLRITLQTLLESQKKESNFIANYRLMEKENSEMSMEISRLQRSLQEANSDANKAKLELEQAENRFMAAKEKLSIAVTKGKSLVQHRDSLKQILAEKTGELDKCLQELHQKSEALQIAEASSEDLKLLLAGRSEELERCLQELDQRSSDLEIAEISIIQLMETKSTLHSLQESVERKESMLQGIEESMSLTSLPDELLSLDLMSKVRWLVDQKQISESIMVDMQKVKDAFSSFDFREMVLSDEIASQARWLGNAFSDAKDYILELECHVASSHAAAEVYEVKLSKLHEEISFLEACSFDAKIEKDALRHELEELTSHLASMDNKLSAVTCEKDGLTRMLLQVADMPMEEVISTDMNTIVNQITSKINSFHFWREQFEILRSQLYIRDVELVLYVEALEEEINEKTRLVNHLNELQSMPDELTTLRDEKVALQKEIERVEEKSALLREKLSLAVKKGKGLMQERDGMKVTLNVKDAEIEKLKKELQLLDSSVVEHKELARTLSTLQEHIQEVHSDILAQKGRDIDSKEKFSIPPIEVLEDPVGTLKWIAKHVKECHSSRVQIMEELEKRCQESTLLTADIVALRAKVELLEDKLAIAEKQISAMDEEQNFMQINMTSLEQKLDNIIRESSILASKLEDARTTIESLEYSLFEAENNISLLKDEKDEVESRSHQNVIQLNAKLAMCTRELDIHSSDIANHLSQLQEFLKDDGLLILISEEFRKKLESFRHVRNFLHDMHRDFPPRLQMHPVPEKVYSVDLPLSLLKLEDHINEESLLDMSQSSSEAMEGLWTQEKLLIDSFKDFFKYIDDHVVLVLQAFEVSRNEIVKLLEVNERLICSMDNMEAHNKSQEVQLLLLRTQLAALLSACREAVQCICLEFHNFQNTDSNAEWHTVLQSKEGGDVIYEDGDEYPKVAEHLLSTIKFFINHSMKTVEEKRLLGSSLDHLRFKLKETEERAESIIQDKNLNRKRVSELENDLAVLNNVCNELRLDIKQYHEINDLLTGKDDGSLSLKNVLATRDEGVVHKLLSESQVRILVEKLNKLEIPLRSSEAFQTDFNVSMPIIDKLYYLIDYVSELQYALDSAVNDKNDIQKRFGLCVLEIERLSKVVETEKQDVETKKTELIELNSGLESIILSTGGKNTLAGDKSVLNVKGMLSILDKLVSGLKVERDFSNSRVQELEDKLLAKENAVNELSKKVKFLEDSYQSRLAFPDTIKERTVFETSTSMGSEISEINDVGSLGKNLLPPVPVSAHARTFRKGSSEHLILNVGMDTEHLISSQETDEKGHVFKSLNVSGLIPKQGKLIADRVDGIWVSTGRMLMSRPGARLGVVAYWLFLHLWLLVTIL